MNTDTDTPAENGDGADGARYAEHRDTTEGRVYTVTGGDWDDVLADTDSSTTNASSSTWVRSTRPRTACCG